MPGPESIAHRRRALEQTLLLDRVEDGEGRGAGDRVAAEGAEELVVDPELIDAPWNAEKIRSMLVHMIVPVIVIGTSGTAAMIRRLRAN